jgi:hypothetical protein
MHPQYGQSPYSRSTRRISLTGMNARHWGHRFGVSRKHGSAVTALSCHVRFEGEDTANTLWKRRELHSPAISRLKSSMYGRKDQQESVTGLIVVDVLMILNIYDRDIEPHP